MSLALSEFPIMNAQLNDEATEITYFDDHNIGMAVATKVGLMVPNIKAVQQKSLLEVAEEVEPLNGCRAGRESCASGHERWHDYHFQHWRCRWYGDDTNYQ